MSAVHDTKCNCACREVLIEFGYPDFSPEKTLLIDKYHPSIATIVGLEIISGKKYIKISSRDEYYEVNEMSVRFMLELMKKDLLSSFVFHMEQCMIKATP